MWWKFTKAWFYLIWTIFLWKNWIETVASSAGSFRFRLKFENGTKQLYRGLIDVLFTRSQGQVSVVIRPVWVTLKRLHTIQICVVLLHLMERSDCTIECFILFLAGGFYDCCNNVEQSGFLEPLVGSLTCFHWARYNPLSCNRAKTWNNQQTLQP